MADEIRDLEPTMTVIPADKLQDELQRSEATVIGYFSGATTEGGLQMHGADDAEYTSFAEVARMRLQWHAIKFLAIFDSTAPTTELYIRFRGRPEILRFQGKFNAAQVSSWVVSNADLLIVRRAPGVTHRHRVN